MSNLGLHFVDNVYSEAQRTRWLQRIVALRPRYVVVLVGSQRAQATQFVAEVRRHSPQTKVIIRHYADGKDDGMWTRIDPDDYVLRIGGLYQQQLAGVDGWYLMPSNEDSFSHPHELELYLDWMIGFADAAHAAKLGIAIGCAPSWHPAPSQVVAGQWDRLFALFAKYRDVIYYRNAYYTQDNYDALKYVANTARYIKSKFNGYCPPIVIGEMARLLAPGAARDGYQSIEGLTRQPLAAEAWTVYQTHLSGIADEIVACWYAVGEWPIGHDTFNVAQDDQFFDELVRLANTSTTPPPPPVIVEPPPGTEDTTEGDPPPDTLTRAEKVLALVQSEIADLESEQQFAKQQYEARMKWLDARRNMLQAKLLLAEYDVESAADAA